MPYYKGDYYRGDYYKGDPFLGAVVGAVARRVVPKAAAWVGRQLGGRAAGAVARDAVVGTVAGATGVALGRRLTGTASPGTGLMPIPQLSPSGPTWGGGKKKYRRMNPLNPKALRRALRRAEGFEKFARKTVSGLRYGPKKFKSQRRAS